jgi:signal transduction histidine kinase
MVPYRGRLALRIARLVVALACGAWYIRAAGLELSWISALLAAYAAYALGALFDIGYETPLRSAIAIVADSTFFALWAWLTPEGWEPAVACAYLLASAVLLHDLLRASIAAAVALFIAVVLPPQGMGPLVWTVVALAGVAAAVGVFKNYLEHRMSATLRANVIIRHQAQGAREAERQRIAADFHDGPLQSFISFQMRLEIIRRLMARDADAAAEELRQLQELCKAQVMDLRSFVRSMRPADEGMGLAASLSRMTELFQRDTGVASSFTSGELRDPAETEVSLELLQIVREALNNVQKHSGATRVALSAGRHDGMVEIVVEDNGGGFPFTGSFQLDELELLRLGPASIKRRVRMLEGELMLESHPGQGSKVSIRVPLG